MKTWKEYEKKAAAWWGDEGIPCTRTSRGIRGEAGDDLRLTTLGISVEVKTRKKEIKTLSTWMQQAERNAHELVPIVQFHTDGTPVDLDYVVLFADDFAKILRRIDEAGGLLNDPTKGD